MSGTGDGGTSGREAMAPRRDQGPAPSQVGDKGTSGREAMAPRRDQGPAPSQVGDKGTSGREAMAPRRDQGPAPSQVGDKGTSGREAMERLVLPVPDLAGPATVLRPWRCDDAPALAAAWRDLEIRSRMPVPDPFDEAAARRWIEQRDRAWAEGRSVDLAVTDPASGAVMGEVGLSGFDPTRRAALAGWWIDAGWRGQGRMGEAVRLVVDWVLDGGLLDAVIAEIGADNPASAAVARRAGLRQVIRPDPAPEGCVGPARLLFARTRTPSG